MDRPELDALYGLYLSEGIGNLRAIAIYQFFGSAERAFAAHRSELLAISGIGEQTVAAFIDNRKETLAKAKRDLDALSSEVQCVSCFDTSYPAILRSIYSPPLLMFVRGNLELLRRDRMVAIVGTRRMSDYGKVVTTEIATGLSQAGVCIVSGFALGVDTCAHKTVFETGGETVGVLGSGIDIIYPAVNKKLAEEIVSSGRGALISEFPVGTGPDAKNFPWRNRIVCGLSSACIVTESDEKGGSMITAEIAQDQGRILYAVPGDINRTTSKGPNQLIVSNKATPVRNADDILQDQGWKSVLINERSARYKQRPTLTLTQSSIVETLDHAGLSLHIDEIAERSKMGVQELLVALLELEFLEIVRQLPGKYFSTIF